MLKSSIIALLLLSAPACITWDVDEPSSCLDANLGTVPAFPVAGAMATGSFTSAYDVSNVISKVSDVSDSIQVHMNNMSVHGTVDMSWLKSVTVTISTKGNHENAPLAHYTAPANASGKDVVFTIDMDNNTLLGFLKHPTMLTYTATGLTTTQPITLGNTVCVDMTATGSKKL